MSTPLLSSFLSQSINSGLRNLLNKRYFGFMMTTSLNNVAWQHAVKDLDPKQVESYHNEQLIRVDVNDRILGPISKGESHAIGTVRNGIYHRALSLLIFDRQGKFLLTQRATSKITFPNYYTNACCSHPLYIYNELEEDGDAIGVKRATIRRSTFELGTRNEDIKPEDLTFVNRLAYRAESDGGQWGEAEIDYIFVLIKDVDLNPNPDEVRSYRYVTKEEMQDLLNNNRPEIKITPWVRLLASDLLFKYWDNLTNLNKIAQTDTIVRYEALLPAN